MFGFRQQTRPTAGARKSTEGTVLPGDLIRKVRRIEISTKRLVDQGVAGDYHSAFKGRGVEFAEVRPYEPGDEVRTIDWNVTARMGTPYVKRFVEERDLNVFITVDVSGSLSYGSRAILKRELAAEIAALLSFAAIRNQDRVGASLISDSLDLFLRPDRRRTHVLRIVRELLLRTGGRGTNLEKGLWETLRNLKQRSVLFLISDFLDTELSAALKAACARHDVVLIEIFDPKDHQPPPRGPVVLRDAESGKLTALGGGFSARKAVAEHAAMREQQRAAFLSLVRKLDVDHLQIRTDRPYLAPLVEYFERRRRRYGR